MNNFNYFIEIQNISNSSSSFSEDESNISKDIFYSSLDNHSDLLTQENNIITSNINIPQVLGKEDNEAHDFIGKKTKRSNSNSEIEKNYKKKGRKTKEEKMNGITGDHSKYNDDNIIRKIKTYLDNNTHKLFNQIITDNCLKLTELCPANRKNIKRDFNLVLLDTSFKKIYIETKESIKYKKINFDSNKMKIGIIYKEENIKKNEEITTLLNLKYGELLDIFLRDIKKINEKLTEITTKIINKYQFPGINQFLEEIEEKERKEKVSEQKIEEYKERIKFLCLYFKDYFFIKPGRGRKNKSKINN